MCCFRLISTILRGTIKNVLERGIYRDRSLVQKSPLIEKEIFEE